MEAAAFDADRPEQTPPASLRWSVLILVSVSMFGTYYAYDAVAPLADVLQRQLGFSDSQIGALNAIYSLPAILMAFVGGIVVDRIGARLATLCFAIVCLVGTALTASSSSFPVMAAGRLVFGLGAESMAVAITVALGQWFAGRELGFAFGVNLSIARAGSYAADISPIWAKRLYEQGWQEPLWLAAGLAAVALFAAAVYLIVERWGDRRYGLRRRQIAPTHQRVILWRFGYSYWHLVGICVAFYSVIFPFRSTFAIKYYQHAHNLSLQDAGAINGVVFLAAIFVTPLFGLLADRVGHLALLMASGSVLLLTAFVLLVANLRYAIGISTVFMGISFALIPAVLWPAVAYVVHPTRLGAAYGLMTMLQNAGVAIGNVAAGLLNDRSAAGPVNPQGYQSMLWMFAVISLSSVIFAVRLLRGETSRPPAKAEYL